MILFVLGFYLLCGYVFDRICYHCDFIHSWTPSDSAFEPFYVFCWPLVLMLMVLMLVTKHLLMPPITALLRFIDRSVGRIFK